ncbi:hypothetical protein I3842_09G123500 [Carya illinoinensis]|uniref:Uncharacterized protein n=1 Tax=Carya illinoinensis TaxID=32201 RepID=A0A922E5M3_CARIL|nr:hypothetical protein I3842_09G123500 [Carya illinoinensis]
MGDCRMTMVLAIYSMVLLSFAAFRATVALEDVGEIAPSPMMESAGAALGLPAAFTAIAFLAAWFF